MDSFEQKLFDTLSSIIEDDQTEVIIYSGPLERPHDDLLVRSYCGKKKKRVLLLLATNGGDAHVAYRIARCFKTHFEHFSVLIHTVCKSAGTLLALGANEIIMSDHAEIGPLDVQIRKADEIGERSSGLTITQALASLQNHAFSMFEEYFLNIRVRSGLQITTKSAMDIAADLTVGLFAPIYGQIDPLRVGELHRAVMVSMEYGERIGKQNLKDKALERLVTGYPDHGFVIDRTEAAELFKNVREPNEKEKSLVTQINSLLVDNIDEDTPYVCSLSEWYFKMKAEKEVPHEQGNNEKTGDDKAGEHSEECAAGKKPDEIPAEAAPVQDK